MSIQKPKYSQADIEAVKIIHKIAPDGVCRVRLEWSESREKWDKHPVAHWPPKSLPKPAHAHWPILKQEILDIWFNSAIELKGIGISCHKFGMVGIDLDEGDMETLISLIESRCGATPLGRAKTQRGSRIYYQVKDEDRYNQMVGWRIDGYDGSGEILLYTQYDYIWDPIATKNAIMANLNAYYKGPPIDLSIFKTTKTPTVERPQINRQISNTDSIDAQMIAEAYGLEVHPDKSDTWRGACPFCNDGETRFEVTQGDVRPLIVCWACKADGSSKNMASIYKYVRKNHPAFAGINRSVEQLIASRSKKNDEFSFPVKTQRNSYSSPLAGGEQRKDEIKIRGCMDETGEEIIGAFIEDEMIAKQIDMVGKRSMWLLNIESNLGQKIWPSLIGIHLIGAGIRKVRYGQIPQFTLDGGQNWETLMDGAEAILWMEVERRIFMPFGKDNKKSVSPSAETRKMVMDILMDNQVDPVKDWLDDLPDFDGIPRLDTNMEDQGMKINGRCELDSGRIIDLTAAAQAFIPLEIVRLTYFPGAQRNPMVVLRGKGREGKSSYGQRILPPHLQEKELFTADYKLTWDSQKGGQLLAKVKINEIREFGLTKYSDLDEVKGNSMKETADYRPPWGKRPITLQRHDVTYVTTNRGNLPADDAALHSRFWYCNVLSRTKLVEKVAWTAFDSLIEGKNYTLREQIFAEAKARVMQSNNPHSYCELPFMEVEESMEYNMKMGGTYDTPGEDFQEHVNETIEILVDEGIKEITMRDMKAAIVCVEHSHQIVNSAEIERVSESTGVGEITRAGAKEMLNTMRNHKNDKVKRAVKRNADLRHEHTPGVWRYEWKRGKSIGVNSKRGPPKFEMIGDVSPDGEEANPFE